MVATETALGAPMPPTATQLRAEAGLRTRRLGGDPTPTPSRGQGEPESTVACGGILSAYRCGGSAGLSPASRLTRLGPSTFSRRGSYSD